MKKEKITLAFHWFETFKSPIIGESIVNSMENEFETYGHQVQLSSRKKWYAGQINIKICLDEDFIYGILSMNEIKM